MSRGGKVLRGMDSASDTARRDSRWKGVLAVEEVSRAVRYLVVDTILHTILFTPFSVSLMDRKKEVLFLFPYQLYLRYSISGSLLTQDNTPPLQG